MLAIYLASLIFGGVILGFSLVFGGGGDDFDSDTYVGSGTDIDADSEIEAYDAGHTGAADSVKFLSFRNITYFLTFFGLTGTLLHLIGSSIVVSLASAIGMGAFAYGFGYYLMRYLKRTESGQGLSIFKLKGKIAQSTMNITETKAGKIVVNTGSSIIDLKALAAGGHKISPGEKVLILDFENDTAIVVKSDFQ